MTTRCFNQSHVQDALENLLVNQQDKDTVRMIFRHSVPAPDDHYNEIKFTRPDRDSIQLGPVVDQGDGRFTCFATIQVEIEVKSDE